MLLREKRSRSKSKKKIQRKIKGIYGLPLFWNSYPMGGYIEAEIDAANTGEVQSE